jgi:hypothetical protein
MTQWDRHPAMTQWDRRPAKTRGAMPAPRESRSYPLWYYSVFRLTGKAALPHRHGPACPGHLYQHPAAIGGPDKPGHDE